jgi:hypothetical protein
MISPFLFSLFNEAACNPDASNDGITMKNELEWTRKETVVA